MYAIRSYYGRIVLVFLAILIIFYILALWLYPGAENEDYWYENGVPLLLWHIIVARNNFV